MPTTDLPEKVVESRHQALLADPRWQLVERVIASPHLSKSGRLCAFLQFVCEETLLGRGDQLNEQKIGVQVFERRVDYDSAEDNIVRSHASRLRQRLEAYFLIEGQNEPLRLTLPRGAYVPQFAPSAASIEDASREAMPEEAPSTGLAKAIQASATQAGTPRAVIILSLVLVAMALVALWQWNARRVLALRSRTESPVMRALWDEVFVPGRQTLIVPADSSLVLYENLIEATVPLRSYMDKSYLAGTGVPSQVTEEIGRREAHRRLTSIADAELIADLLRIPEAIQTPPVIRFARDVQVSDLKGSNGVLIGAREANPWLAMFEARRNFIIDDDQQTRIFTVSNRSPRSGESRTYYAQPGDPKHLAYALIALVPNLDSSGYLLIVEGTSIAGTEAAADFLTHRPSRIEGVLAPVFKQYGHIPPFEILLETTNLNGSATESRVVAIRTTP
jgi:hypothetical protein